MKKKIIIALVLALLALLIVLPATASAQQDFTFAPYSFAGAGWIPSLSGVEGERATFDVAARLGEQLPTSYPLVTANYDFAAHGILRYNDPAMSVRLIGRVDTAWIHTSINQYVNVIFQTFTGTYRPLRGGQGGSFQVWGAGDSSGTSGFALLIIGGVYDGYRAEPHVIGGGQITITLQK